MKIVRENVQISGIETTIREREEAVDFAIAHSESIGNIEIRVIRCIILLKLISE